LSHLLNATKGRGNKIPLSEEIKFENYPSYKIALFPAVLNIIILPGVSGPAATCKPLVMNIEIFYVP
jgi:hypothetical protein